MRTGARVDQRADPVREAKLGSHLIPGSRDAVTALYCLGDLAGFYTKLGRTGEAVASLDQLEDLARQRYVPPSARLLGDLAVGDYERTLEWLEKGYQQRDSQLPHVHVIHMFQPLHADPRFQDVLRRQGLRP